VQLQVSDLGLRAPWYHNVLNVTHSSLSRTRLMTEGRYEGVSAII
jgi:hypothetical protein